MSVSRYLMPYLRYFSLVESTRSDGRYCLFLDLLVCEESSRNRDRGHTVPSSEGLQQPGAVEMGWALIVWINLRIGGCLKWQFSWAPALAVIRLLSEWLRLSCCIVILNACGWEYCLYASNSSNSPTMRLALLDNPCYNERSSRLVRYRMCRLRPRSKSLHSIPQHLDLGCQSHYQFNLHRTLHIR